MVIIAYSRTRAHLVPTRRAKAVYSLRSYQSQLLLAPLTLLRSATAHKARHTWQSRARASCTVRDLAVGLATAHKLELVRTLMKGRE